MTTKWIEMSEPVRLDISSYLHKKYRERLAEMARGDAADLRGPLAAFGVFYVADKGLALPPEF